MSDALSQVESILPKLSDEERVQLVERLASEMGIASFVISVGAGVDKQSNVCGGEARIIRTRIPVWLLEQARRLGKSDEQLLAAYPSLRKQDLRNAWAYVKQHIEEIEQHIREHIRENEEA